jgi:hypothetical protein
MLRLYSLYISVRRSVTLPDAVKWRCFYYWAGGQVCCEASLLPRVGQSG